MLKVKSFSNYYNFLDKVSLLVNYVSFAPKIFNIFKSIIENVSVKEKVEGERCMSAEGSSLKGSSQQTSTSGPKVKGGGPLFSGRGPLIMGGLVNDTTLAHYIEQNRNRNFSTDSINL